MFIDIIVTAAQARSLDELEELYYEGPEATIDGITCGACSKIARTCNRPAVKHASVEHVRYCFALIVQMDEESKAERAAELSVERFFEERGGAEYDPRERELWAREDFLAGR